MSTVVVTGATGVLGRHLRPALAGGRVLLLTRRCPALEANEEWRRTDLSVPLRLPPLPPDSTLCHLAYAMADGASNLDYTANAIAAVNSCPDITHVVMISSISVYGLRTTGRIDEHTRCRPDSEYARIKLACEQMWLDALRPDCRLTVLRPGAILAPGGPGLRALARDAVQRPLRGVVKRSLLRRGSVHFVAVGNVVAAITFVLSTRTGPARQIFVVSDDHQPQNASYAAMQDAVRAVCGRPPLPALPLPVWVEHPLGRLLRRPLGVRRTFSSQALHEAGFRDVVVLRDQIEEIVHEQVPFFGSRGGSVRPADAGGSPSAAAPPQPTRTG